MYYALLVLDKNRMLDGRKDIKFIDTTNLQPAKLKAAMASGETETVCPAAGNRNYC